MDVDVQKKNSNEDIDGPSANKMKTKTLELRIQACPKIKYDDCREFDSFAGTWVDSKGQDVVISPWGVIRYPNNPKLRFEATFMGPNHLSVTFDKDPKRRKFVGKLNHACTLLVWSNDTKWIRKGLTKPTDENKHLKSSQQEKTIFKVMDSKRKIQTGCESKPKNKSFTFWKTKPGIIKHMNKNDPHKTSKTSGNKAIKKRHSTSITVKLSSMLDSHLMFKHRKNAQTTKNTKANDDNIDKNMDVTVDMNDLIQPVKQERGQQTAQEKNENKNDSQSKKPESNNNPSEMLEWDEMKNENERLARKNLNRVNLLTKLLSDNELDIRSIRTACWRGIPKCMRASIWKLLLGYIPSKRNEYYCLIERHKSEETNKIVDQIAENIARASHELKLFQIPSIFNLLSRALYLWTVTHTAARYAYDINDLILPFVYTFLDEFLIQNYNGVSLDSDFELSKQIINDKLTKNELLKIE
eukprot:269204_1